MTRKNWIRSGFALAACGGLALAIGLAPTRAADDAAKPQNAAPVLNVGGDQENKGGGTITGRVVYTGNLPTPKALDVSADKYCVAAHPDGPPVSEDYVWGDEIKVGPRADGKPGKAGTVALPNVFVYVSKGLEGKKFDAPKTKATVTQQGCVYVPHVQGVMVNQPFVIHNGDATSHNVHLYASANPGFNEGQNKKDMEKEVKFSKTEMEMRFGCDVHGWMKAYVHVMDHPFFAVTGKDGTFTIKGLPPGEYEVKVWHEFAKFGATPETMTVTVKEGETKDKVDFTYGIK